MIILRSVFTLLPASVRNPVRRAVRHRQMTQPRSAESLVRDAFANLRPLKIVPSNDDPCVTMVTDSVAPGQLMGGVGTAVLLAASIAAARGWRLRIVTREFRCNDQAVRALLAIQGVLYEGPIDILFSDGFESDQAVPLGANDLVLTTSWWGTWSTRCTVPANQIVYLLQEDERMFYPGGQQHLMCDETLSDISIRYVINSELLLTHFKDTKTLGPSHRGLAFEPAFPESIYHPEGHGERRNLLFYARPDHPRNLFLRGVETLQQAFASGLFPANRWNVHFFGVNVPNVRFPNHTITIHNTLPWAQYASLIRQADLGFSLMYTPHPSYPPLDLAASGSVVVTNRFGPKGRESHYCENIIYAALSVDSLLKALRHGAERAEDLPRRQAAYANARLNRDWATAFAPVLATLAKAPAPAA